MDSILVTAFFVLYRLIKSLQSKCCKKKKTSKGLSLLIQQLDLELLNQLTLSQMWIKFKEDFANQIQ